MLRFMGLSVALLLVSSLHARADYSATVIGNAYDSESGHGVYDNQVGFTTASADYANPQGGSASGYGTLEHGFGGGFTAKAFATATGGSGDDGQYVSNHGSGAAFWQDQLHFTNTPTDVFVEFVFSFDGTTSGDAVGEASFSASDINGTFLAGGSQTHSGTLFYGRDADLTGEQIVLIDVGLTANATGHGSGFPGPHTSTASFAHSLSLIAITPRDAFGNFLPDVVITSDSGIDYNPLIKVAPEPTASALLILGVVCVAFHSLRQRFARKRWNCG